MVSLLNLFEKLDNYNKMIVMAGSAGSGKSTLLKELKPELKGFEYLNPDTYVEDPKSMLHGNLAAASARVDDVDVPSAIETGKNFVWDTTAANPSKMLGGLYRKKEVDGILNTKGYDKMMIACYVHPIVSFIRNFERDRKVPKQVIFSTWRGVYSNLKNYQQKLGNNFLLYRVPSEGYEEQIAGFNKAVGSGKLFDFLAELIELDPAKYASTFRKDVDTSTLSDKEKEKRAASQETSRKQYAQELEKIEEEFYTIMKAIDTLDPLTLPEVKSEVARFVNS